MIFWKLLGMYLLTLGYCSGMELYRTEIDGKEFYRLVGRSCFLLVVIWLAIEGYIAFNGGGANG